MLLVAFIGILSLLAHDEAFEYLSKGWAFQHEPPKPFYAAYRLSGYELKQCPCKLDSYEEYEIPVRPGKVLVK